MFNVHCSAVENKMNDEHCNQLGEFGSRSLRSLQQIEDRVVGWCEEEGG